MKFIYLTFVFLFCQLNLYASSCCGGGSSSSLIIVGDNRNEFSLGYSFRNDLGQTDQDGWSYFNKSNIKDQKHIINIQAQHAFEDYWQLGFKTSAATKNIQKSGKTETNSGLSDFDIQITKEYLPEFTYSPWKPRGFYYSKVSIPFSKSLYNSNSSIMSDVRGSGFFTFTLGNFFVKRINDFTFKLTTEVTHFFGRQFNQTKVESYQKYALPIGVSYAFPDTSFSIGATDTFNYQTAKKISGATNNTSNAEYNFELNGFINYAPNREEIYTLSYSDSTLIGKSINSSLYRSWGLTYTYVMPL